MNKLRFILLLGFVSIFSIISNSIFATTPPVSDNKATHEAEVFKPGEMIIEHIIDNHEWHIFTWNTHHYSVPLPVILYDRGKIVVFSSGRFHHGTASYIGYKIENEGKNKRKIVKVLDDGVTTNTKEPLPLDFSVTRTVAALILSMFLLILILSAVVRRYKRHPNTAPKGLQIAIEALVNFIKDDIAIPSIGVKMYERYMPFLLTLFFFILMNNIMGLIPFFPFGTNVTGNIAITMSLALFTFVITTFSGNKMYWKHIFNAPGVPWWLKFPIPLMPIVELIGVFTKPFVLMVRLFANITAGHIVILGFMSLIFIFARIHTALGLGVSVVSIAFTLFMDMLELLVAFIQAYVFTLLSALYFGMATQEHH
ncbi:MAG: F0F1 ATP synthase subunit A [Lentimicrobiaceae bacterium]|jgi:F-type H+-transporting ATPase subunit a|nr:F0F1 ATP synthase subunit A [Lentimicrobiaceae bacterium]